MMGGLVELFAHLDSGLSRSKLWSLFTHLCDDLDADAVVGKLELTHAGAGAFLLTSTNDQPIPIFHFPPWAIPQETQAQWTTLEDGIRKMREILEVKRGIPPWQYSRGTNMPANPLGYSKIADLSSAKGLSDGTLGGVPPGTWYALVATEGADVRWRDDGVDPTNTDGMLLVQDNTLKVDINDATAIKFIETAASATLHISFYGFLKG